ncbi:MAG: hypothetical protein HYZ26_14675 [Chloroflexi bacterium]|nr:hypothetical protein [Chloroflexota bacterium]
MPTRHRRFALFSILALLLISGLPACSSGAADLELLGMEHLPQAVQDAPTRVSDAYRFAAANPDLMQQFPCYCGCGSIGHTSNYACYVSGADAAGNLVFDGHALGCQICVDITQDVMRMMRDGEDVPDMQAFIDQTYGRYGPSNLP